MKKTSLYITVAVALGITMILVPTWFFLFNVNQYGEYDVSFARHIPLVEYPEQDLAETVSSRELEFLGISFFVALVIYILFRQRIPRSDNIWPPFRQ